ncbi:MAG: 16S rRNA (cytidine(1402)-2'-O)-methyltransferase [Gemmatimonadaceae bacterium]|nr:16S rRNA (cytidine(1402)-2'-O)-methyltransferase [Gemmatimonadaceae bacterium]
MSTEGVLALVSTPIGNLGDLSPRAVATLAAAELVLAEDTRHSRHLLDHAGIRVPLESLHEHNEAARTPVLVERLLAGAQMALISDAGTPLVSDPGARLVHAAIEAGVRVVPIPGPSAVLAALVASGLPSDRFTFLGFLPRKGKERRALINEIAESRHTVVVYEAPGRVGETLGELAAAGMGERAAAVARELTKQYEEVRRGTLAELAAYYGADAPRGEVVLVISGAAPRVLDEAALTALADEWRAAGLPARDIMQRLTEGHAAPRNLAYRLAHR